MDDEQHYDFQMNISIENVKLYHNLEERVKNRTREVKLILANIEQGILSIEGENAIISNEFSSHLITILGFHDIAYRSFISTILSKFETSESQKNRKTSSRLFL